MQQQPFLHRRQWVDVVDLRGGYRQAVDLFLSQLRQREVRRREAAVAWAQAVLNQAQQLCFVGLSQSLNGVFIVPFTAKRPAQLQLTGIHLAIDTQPVRQRRLQVMGHPSGLIHRLEQRIGLELLVELAKVVEGDPRLRQGGHGFAHSGVRQVAQDTVTQAFMGHLAQLLLDRLDRRRLSWGTVTQCWAQA
ncbi:hypothetical protein D3C79_590730 [compost metagenome]